MINLNELLSRVRALIYLYFEALEYKVSTELQRKTDRLLFNGRALSYEDAVKILQLKDKLEIMKKIEIELNQVLDGIREN